MNKTPGCPWCVVAMVQTEDELSWKCPDCGGVWSYLEDPRGNNIQVMWRDEQRYKKSMSEPGGGGASGRKHEKPKRVYSNDWKIVE